MNVNDFFELCAWDYLPGDLAPEFVVAVKPIGSFGSDLEGLRRIDWDMTVVLSMCLQCGHWREEFVRMRDFQHRHLSHNYISTVSTR